MYGRSSLKLTVSHNTSLSIPKDERPPIAPTQSHTTYQIGNFVQFSSCYRFSGCQLPAAMSGRSPARRGRFRMSNTSTFLGFICTLVLEMTSCSGEHEVGGRLPRIGDEPERPKWPDQYVVGHSHTRRPMHFIKSVINGKFVLRISTVMIL
jgi:hypothetical protein